ncbi:MAG: ABC transporter ATP-binding protein [Reyranella sp.]|uniref:ABC transporter ATP-binding protein n=1 Tax=Reyranella sp. TaxID=1929291 RepID=UPI001ACD3A22|nr:ABC transporter ATP-binding protein [Reyranella sp.]MBN9089292.1 ABC transporter ATP-binding protein [Reyranella sp.]
MTALVSLSGLTVDFDTGKRIVRALHGIDLEVRRGEALGLVGESGCGKSVTWLAALGLLGSRARVGGAVRLEGRDLVGTPVAELERVRGRHIAMIFQDPSSSLNPVHRIGRQLGEALKLHRGLDGGAAEAEARRLLDRVHIADAQRRLGDYPHELSGGMNQRVMIAMALAGQPDLLVADEPTTALDATVQAQILELLGEIRRDSGMALVLISHDLGVVAENTDRVCVMYAGRIVEDAPIDTVFEAPAHPYTKGLLAALPELDGARRVLTPIAGVVPEPWNLPKGCSFAPRCDRRVDACEAAPPLPTLREADHRVACIRA